MNINDMKEPILAITKEGLSFLGLQQGFNPMSWDQFQAGIDPADLLVGERALLEVDFDKRHFIPYLLIKSPYVMPSYFVYQRGKGVGEQRLAGGDSCGLGGHTDRADVVKVGDSDVINLRQSLDKAARRELDEELVPLGLDPLDLKFIGLIVDDSNEVGKVHIGVVYVAQSYNPDPEAYQCKEPELQAVGILTVRQALDRPKLESWSKILMTYLLAQQDAGLDGEDSSCDRHEDVSE